MKSIHVFAVRAVITLAVLLVVIHATPASAQGGLNVTVQRNGQPLTPREVVLYAASGVKTGTLASNTATFAADVITASLEGKAATAIVDECEDGRVSLFLVQDDSNVQAPTGDGTCRRRRLGAFVIRRGATIVIDTGRGTVADSSRAVSSGESGGGGLGIGVFGGASGAWGGFNIGDPTRASIGTRFNSTNPPYQQYNVDVDDRASGLSFGGGVNLQLVGSSFGARAGILRENERDVPQQSVNGRRVEGGLQFQQLGSSAVQSWTLYAGPTLTLPWGVIVSGGPSFTIWDLELTQTGQLQAGCPNPCAVVRTDNNTERTSGSDLGVQVGADYYPGNGWFGLSFMYLLTTYHDASDPSRPLAYPRDWRDSNLFLGGVVRTLPRRR